MRRVGAWLALFALWLQLALSFGHFHPNDVFGPLGHPVVQGYGGAEAAADERRIPLGPFHDERNDGVCAVCANMALAGSLVLPGPVALPLPAGTAAAPIAGPRRFVLISTPFLLFRTRAPPRA